MKFKELLEHSLPHSMNYGSLKALRIKPLLVLGFVNEIGHVTPWPIIFVPILGQIKFSKYTKCCEKHFLPLHTHT